METRRDVFQAIADPTRREIIGLLASSSLNVNAIADNFSMSRQAISLHVKMLQQCNLITVQKQGRERICQVKLEGLQEVYDWTEQYRLFWTTKLQGLKQVVHAANTTSSDISDSSLKQKP